MKRTILAAIILIMAVAMVNGQNDQKKISPAGTWKFEAPYAPEGFTSGKINIGLAEKATASISFTGNESRIPGEKVTAKGDSLKFSVYLEGVDVSIRLRLESAAKMSGKAVYYEGEIPLTLTRENTQQK